MKIKHVTLATVKAKQIILEKIIILVKEYSPACEEIKCITNKEVKLHVRLF